MSKISRNIFVGGMDTDSSPEIIDNKSYRMARNVISNTLTNDGVLHNMEGSLAKAAVNANWRDGGGSNVGGDWICNGLFTSNDESKIYMFLYASTQAPVVPPNYLDRSMLFEYDIATDTWEVVLAGVDDNINWSGEVLDANIISFREQDFLFWLNYDGVPYKVEVAEAIEFTTDIGLGGSYTDNELNSITSVIQAPPLYPPTTNYTNVDIENTSNKIIGVYSFKYRYIYENGGVSAFSPVSKVFYDVVLADASYENNDYYYNAIEVGYEETFDNIESIEIAFKLNTDWFSIPVIESRGVGSYTHTFVNNDLYIAVGTDPLNTKYYDNVPITALSQAFIKNKIAYSNYLDNYDSATDLSFHSAVKYEDLAGAEKTTIPHTFTTSDFGTNIDPPNPPNGELDNYFVLKKTDIENNASVGDYIYINIFESARVHYIAEVENYFYTWSFNYIFLISDMNTILEEIKTQIEITSVLTYDNIVGSEDSVWLDVFSDTTEVTVRMKSTVCNAAIPATDVPLTHETGTLYKIEAGDSDSITSFKVGASHSLGAVYYDRFNRQNDVAATPEGVSYVKWFDERNASSSYEKDGASSLLWAIDSQPPIWAENYQIVYSKNVNTNKFDTYICDELIPESLTLLESDDSDTARVYIRPLDYFIEDNRKTPLNYIYEEGDKFRLLAYYDGSDLQYNIDKLEVTILESKIDENGDSYLVITLNSYTILNNYLNSKSASNDDKFAMEIRNQTAEASSELFYEIGQMFSIGDSGLPTRFHNGQLRNQDDDLSSINGTDMLSKIGNNKYKTVSAVASSFAGFQYGDLVTVESGIAYPIFNGVVIENINDDTIIFRGFNAHHNVGLDTTSFTIQAIDAATGEIDNGDTYIRTRTYTPEWDGGNRIDTEVKVDTKLPSDFVKYFNDGLGRSQVVKQDKKGVVRDASIIISQAVNEDFNFFGTTSFPNNANDFIDLDNSFGQIDEIINLNDNLYVIQDSRVGIQQVQKNVVSTADGTGLISAVANVFGEWIPVADGIGTRGKRGYTQKFKGSLYMLDYEGKAAYTISGRDIKDITSKTLHSKMVEDSFVASGKSGIIPSRNEYVVRLQDGWYSFGAEDGQWVTAFDFSASHFVYANGKYYTTNFDKLIEHEESSTAYNTFYNDEGFPVVLPSTVTIIANDKKFLNKSYESFALSGVGIESARVLDISTNISTTADIETLDKQEGIFYKDIGGGSSKDSTIVGKPLGIGDPDAVLNSGVDDSLRFPFIIPPYVSTGDNIYQDQGGTIVSLGLVVSIGTSNTIIQLDNAGTAIVSNPVFITKPSEKDGEDIKGQYIECTVEFGTDDKPQYISALDFEGASSELTH